MLPSTLIPQQSCWWCLAYGDRYNLWLRLFTNMEL